MTIAQELSSLTPESVLNGIRFVFSSDQTLRPQKTLAVPIDINGHSVSNHIELFDALMSAKAPQYIENYKASGIKSKIKALYQMFEDLEDLFLEHPRSIYNYNVQEQITSSEYARLPKKYHGIFTKSQYNRGMYQLNIKHYDKNWTLFIPRQNKAAYYSLIQDAAKILHYRGKTDTKTQIQQIKQLCQIFFRIAFICTPLPIRSTDINKSGAYKLYQEYKTNRFKKNSVYNAYKKVKPWRQEIAEECERELAIHSSDTQFMISTIDKINAIKHQLKQTLSTRIK